jgi:hypothetical protein
MGLSDDTASPNRWAFNLRVSVMRSISRRIASCRISVCVSTAARSGSVAAISSRIALPVSTYLGVEYCRRNRNFPWNEQTRDSLLQ